jgi:hypothetical protein
MYKHAALFLVLASLPLAAIGCGGSTQQQSNSQQTDGGTEGGVVPEGGGGTDAGHDSGMQQTCTPTNGTLAPGYPAMHGPMPQVTYQNGGLLLNPEIVTVTFPNDPLKQQLEEFGDGITQTCWWDAIRAGYCESSGMSCVGRGTVPAKPHVEMTAAPATSYTDTASGGASTMATFVQQQVSSGAFPAPNANTLYVLWFPASTTITLDGAASCQTFLGYHNSTTVTPPGGSNTVVSYAVLPRCQTTISGLTFDASHEIAEAATDPHVGNNQVGFYLPMGNNDALAWDLIGGGEIGDLCVDLLGDSLGLKQDQTTAKGATGTTWTVQRLWSNANAAAGLDPCVPMPSNETYFNLAPPAGMNTIQLAVGATATYTATAFSSGPMNAWQLIAQDIAALQGQQPYLQISLTKGGAAANTAQNGDQITVSITLLKQPPTIPGTNIAGMQYLLVSAVSQQGPLHYWPGLVVAQ